MRALLPFLLLPLLLTAASTPVANAAPQADKAKAQLYGRTEGDEVRLALRIRIEEGWHLYHHELGNETAVGKPTVITIAAGEGAQAGEWSEVRFPEPLKLPQEYGKDGKPTWIWGHEGTIVLYALGQLSEGLGLDDVELDLMGLTCQDDGSCIPYEKLLEVEGEGPDVIFDRFPKDLKLASAASSPKKVARTGPDDKAKAHLYARAAENGDVLVAISIDIDEGWHLYHEELGPEDAVGIPTDVQIGRTPGAWSRVRFPEPLKLPQEYGKNGKPTWIFGHEGEIVLYARGRLPAGQGPADVATDVVGLTCEDDGSCIPWEVTLVSEGAGPAELFKAFPSDLKPPGEGEGGSVPEVGSGGSGAAGSSGGGSTTGLAAGVTAIDWAGTTFADYQPRNEETERSLFLWLVFAFIAGLILNVMPCVLPVVSIKVLSFVQQAGESRARIFQLGLAFAGGILAVFLALASLAAFAGKGWGEQFQSPEFLIVMVAIVFGFGLSLFDVFEIGVPTQVGQLAAVRREGLGHAFFMGIMSTVLATPCSGPFLGSTLTWALAQPATTVFLVFTFVGLGMASPYVLLTANPGFLKYVPKPGAWMQTFKHLMGFLLMGTVIFLLVSVPQDLLLYTVAFLVFVGMACWVWGRYATFDQNRVKRLGTVAVVLAILAFGGRTSFIDMRRFFGDLAPEGEGHLVWEDFDPIQLQRYHDQGRSVMLDFTADWCLTCKTNEKVVYESEEIVKILTERGIVAMKADETGRSPKTESIKRLREKLGSSSIPFVSIFPGDDWLRPHTFKDLVTRGEIGLALEDCPVFDAVQARADR